ACRDWLDQQIEIISPKVFVPLGRYAMSRFIPGRIISQEHGNLYTRGGKVYFIMYHPAVALYKGSMRTVLIEDFQNLKKFLDGNLEPISLDDVVDDIIKEKSEIEKPAKSEQVGMF
ncbi:MAG: uracil-DNA glycosylase family protein, partial [bacterium]